MRILITGANGTMAKETIRHLIHRGFADIVMAVRTDQKGETAKREILLRLVGEPSHHQAYGLHTWRFI